MIAIFHSLSHKEYKDRLLNSFKNNGLKLIANATAALSMGVNFPDVRYVIMYGPARSLLDFHQEALVGLEAVSYTHLTLPTKRIV